MRPVPRAMRKRTVSAWSEAVCPVAMRGVARSAAATAGRAAMAQVAGALLQARAGRRARAARRARQAERARPRATTASHLAGRLGPQPVVDRQDAHRAVVDLGEQVHQADGVGAARDHHQHRRPGGEQRVPPAVVGDAGLGGARHRRLWPTAPRGAQGFSSCVA